MKNRGVRHTSDCHSEKQTLKTTFWGGERTGNQSSQAGGNQRSQQERRKSLPKGGRVLEAKKGNLKRRSRRKVNTKSSKKAGEDKVLHRKSALLLLNAETLLVFEQVQNYKKRGAGGTSRGDEILTVRNSPNPTNGEKKKECAVVGNLPGGGRSRKRRNMFSYSWPAESSGGKSWKGTM